MVGANRQKCLPRSELLILLRIAGKAGQGTEKNKSSGRAVCVLKVSSSSHAARTDAVCQSRTNGPTNPTYSPWAFSRLGTYLAQHV